jgi:hypothetical protein
MSFTSRTVLASLVVTGLAAPASAGELLGNGQIELEVRLPTGNGDFALASEIDKEEFFDAAHCACPANENTTFAVRLRLVNGPGNVNRPVEVWVGEECDDKSDPDARDQRCTKIREIADVDTLITPENVLLSVHDLIAADLDIGECVATESTVTVWALIDDGGGGSTYEEVFTEEIFVDTLPPPLPTDIEARAGENAVQIEWELAVGQEDDVFYFQALCARTDGSVSPDDPFGDLDPRYDVFEEICPEALPAAVWLSHANAAYNAHLGGGDGGLPVDAGPDPDGGLGTDDAGTGGPDAGTDVPDVFDGFPADLLCGESTGGSLRIEGLENGVTYDVALLVMDRAGNVQGTFLGSFRPAPVTDFWEDYHDRGGNADGGICLSTSTFGNNHPLNTALRDFRDDTLASFALGRWFIGFYYEHLAALGALVEGSVVARFVALVMLTPVALVAAFWVYTGIGIKLLVFAGLIWLLRRRRRSRRRPGPAYPGRLLASGALAALVLVGLAPPATAQPVYDPYWNELDEPQSRVGPTEPRWVFELKFGPYVPDIDGEFDAEPGPFEMMFGGGPAIMPVLELDRFFLFPAGQLGIGVSLGYMGKTANAYEPAPDGDLVIDPETGEPVRSSETTSFRMVPAALLGVYRFTGLHDQTGIPLVPYGKLGLSYYLWWITKPGGDLAEVPSPECGDPPAADCEMTDKALGASIGWQGTVGLAIRAEDIDKQAALNMRNQLGIEHAGFFAELTYADVDGFGADDRLRVGDLTWFAGINFEF